MNISSTEKALRLRYRLYGFPQDWFGVTFNDIPLTPPEAQRLKGAFSTLRRGSVCYVQGSPAPIVNQYIELGYVVRGVDASIYIADPFDKEDKRGLPEADCIVLYNCSEGTTQINLVQKVIKRLVKGICANTMIILNSDINARAFVKDYYNCTNTCNIPQKAEEKWL